MSFEALVEQAQSNTTDSVLDARYDGTYQLPSIGLSVPQDTRVLAMNVNWCRLAVDSMAEVLTVDGFECAELEDDALATVWRVWQSSDMATFSQLAHSEALAQGEAFAIVGVNAGNAIRTQVRSRSNIAVGEVDGVVHEAVVLQEVQNEYGSTVTEAVYYTPQQWERLWFSGGQWTNIDKGGVRGCVPVIPVRNRMRVGDVAGRSEMGLVADYADAASRSFTLLQLATEIMSVPQRWIAGGDLSNFKRPDGSMPSISEIYLGSFLTSPDASAKFGQFSPANLNQIIDELKLTAEMVSAMTGIPVSMLGVTTSNPASAEAMRAAKERMISRGEFKQRIFGDAWEQWARVVLSLSGFDTTNTERLSAVWRDIANVSNSARAANLLQAHAQGVISARTARDGLPLTPEQRARENAADDYRNEWGTSGTIREL